MNTTTTETLSGLATVQRLIDEVINTRQIDLCDRYLAPDRVDHQDYGLPRGAADGHEGFKKVLGPFCEAFPDLRLAIEFSVFDGDRLAAYVTTSGTQKGPFMGLPATGRSFKVKGTDIFRFNDEGQVSEHWGVFDTLGMLAQLGHGPASS
jgi:steroid delta-isomerase-like uncharacterized protein